MNPEVQVHRGIAVPQIEPAEDGVVAARLLPLGQDVRDTRTVNRMARPDSSSRIPSPLRSRRPIPASIDRASAGSGLGPGRSGRNHAGFPDVTGPNTGSHAPRYT